MAMLDSPVSRRTHGDKVERPRGGSRESRVDGRRPANPTGEAMVRGQDSACGAGLPARFRRFRMPTDVPVSPTAKKPGLIKRLYDWCMAQAHTPRAVMTMNAVSFVESSFFPIPPDPLLIALCYANPAKWWRYAAWCTLYSVLGGMLGYYLGLQFEPFV